MIPLTIYSYSFIYISLLFTPILSSKGIFEIHIKKYFLYKSLNLTKCCSNLITSSRDCASECSIFMEICLSIYQKVPHRYACDIGENMIMTDILGNEQLSNSGNKDYTIKVRERWMKNFNILVRIKHRDKITKKEELIVTLSSAEENVKPSLDWITKQLSNPKDQFQLFVSFRYSCSQYHYGDMCDKYCKPSKGVIGNYNCSDSGDIVCHSGYNGAYCDKVVCQNICVHGTCIGPNLCRCFTGWTGESCNKCIPYPGCVNGACRRDDKSNDLLPLTCDCKKGWGGMFCNIDLNYCLNNRNVCLNDGECQNFGDINTNQQYRCICKPGFKGTHCEKSVSNCLVRGCQNDGVCDVNENKNISKCICKESFYGDQCQFNMTSCVEDPCIGSNSKCFPDLKVGFRCDCATGFIGRNCEIDKDECSTNPCLNGGMCIDRASGFRCVCPVGFFGHRCQVNKNDCQRLSCMNGAKCMDKANRIDCECTPGWTGSICDKNINECAVNQPCQNNGKCEDTLGSYKCICPPSWSGIHCEIRIAINITNITSNRCFINPCRHNGICLLSLGKENPEKTELLESIGGPYYCVCPPGFTGPLCNQVIVATGSISNRNVDLISTPFSTLLDKINKTHMTLINLIIISIGVPSILIVLLVIILIWCKTSKKFKKPITTSKYQNNIMKNHNFVNNANIKILNNKLHQNNGMMCNNEKIPLSVKSLQNQLLNEEMNNCSINSMLPHLPLYTYKCSMITLDEDNHSCINHSSNIVKSSNSLPLKSINNDFEKNICNEKSVFSNHERDAEPESNYYISNFDKEIINKHDKQPIDVNLKSQIDNGYKEALGSNPNMYKRHRNNYLGQNLCSSQNSLLEEPVDKPLRTTMPRQFCKNSDHTSSENNFRDMDHQRNISNNKTLNIHNHNLESRPAPIKCLSLDNSVEPDYNKAFIDNNYVLYYTRSIAPQKINYNLISNPKFRETSCFFNSSTIYPSIRSVRTNSTMIDDNSSMNP